MRGHFTLTVKIEQLSESKVCEFEADAAVCRALDAEDVLWLEVPVQEGRGQAVEVVQGGGEVLQLPPHVPFLKHLTFLKQRMAAEQTFKGSSETICLKNTRQEASVNSSLLVSVLHDNAENRAVIVRAVISDDVFVTDELKKILLVGNVVLEAMLQNLFQGKYLAFFTELVYIAK